MTVIVHETEVPNEPADVWDACTTPEGLAAWMAPNVDVDLREGGAIRSSFDPDLALGEPGTITHEILAMEPEHRLAFRITTAPDEFEHAAATRGTQWSLALEGLPGGGTRVRMTHHGFSKDEAGEAAASYFEEGDGQQMAALRRVLTEDPENAA